MAKTVLVFRDAGREKVALGGGRGRAAQSGRGATRCRPRKSAGVMPRLRPWRPKSGHAPSRLSAAGLGKMSEGDLTIQLDAGFTETYRQIRDDFNATIEKLRETIGSIV